MTAINLDHAERSSGAVKKLLEYCDARIKELHDKIEKSADHAATEKIRGQISEIRDLQSKFREIPAFRPVSAEHN